MSQRLNEYFAGEAADYLQQLSALLASPVAPDPVRLLRLATGVRGSTQMAGADDLADLASHFEASAREMLQGSAEWSDDIRELSRRTVSEMQALVYSIDRWGEEEASRIRAVARLWISSREEPEVESRSEPLDDADRPDPDRAEVFEADGSAVPADPASVERHIVPISHLFFDDAGPHIVEAPSVGAADLQRVPIGNLLYGGTAALRAAASLRPAIERIVRGESTDRSPDDVLNELFDLIQLAMTPEAAEV